MLEVADISVVSWDRLFRRASSSVYDDGSVDPSESTVAWGRLVGSLRTR